MKAADFLTDKFVAALAVAVVGLLGTLGYFFSQSALNAAIAKTQVVIDAKAAIEEVKSQAKVANTQADLANQKADKAAAILVRISDNLKAQTKSFQDSQTATLVALATVTTKLEGVQTALIRVEDNQDRQSGRK